MLLIVCVGMSKAGNEKKMHIFKKKKGRKERSGKRYKYIHTQSENQRLNYLALKNKYIQ